MQSVCSSSSIFGCTEEFKYSRDPDHCRQRITCDSLPARSHFSVTRKQRKYVRLALGKNPVWMWSGVGFLRCSLWLYSSNMRNFGTVPDNTVRPLRKTSFRNWMSWNNQLRSRCTSCSLDCLEVGGAFRSDMCYFWNLGQRLVCATACAKIVSLWAAAKYLVAAAARHVDRAVQFNAWSSFIS